MSSFDPIETRHFSNGLPDDKSTYLLLDVSDRGVILPDDFGAEILLPEHNLLIYAETVTINKDIRWSGKNISIACSNLSLASSITTIDVSGSDGDGVVAEADKPGKAGNPGSGGGSISLYIEQFDTGIIGGLKLKANGGDGGVGGATSDPLQKAGVGGKGGNAGTISYLWGSQTGSALALLSKVSKMAWVPGCGQSSAIMEKTTSLLTEDTVATLSAVFARYTQFISAASACANNITTLLKLNMSRSSKALSPKLSTDLSTFAKTLKDLITSQEGPDLLNDDMKACLDNLTSAITRVLQNLSKNITVNSDDIDATLGLVPVLNNNTSTTALRKCLDQASQKIMLMFYSIANQTASNCQVMAGSGGIGGMGFGPQNLNGARGEPGVFGTLFAHELAFNGRPEDANVPMVYAFPDQCQMLLNKANDLFFQNTPSSVQSASILYSRLLKRLSFVPTLLDPSNSTTKTPTILDQYGNIEYVLKLSVSAIDQLQSVFAGAQSFSNQIMVGKDMFGHDPQWVPRLTYNYYADEAEKLLAKLKTIEEAYNSASAIRASSNEKASAITSGQQAAIAGKQSAHDRIELITEDNGPLVSSADTISQYTPLLSAKIQEVVTDVAAVTDDIRAAINFDPLDIISALSMVAMAPSVPLGIVEGGKVAFDAFTTVKDDKGTTVNSNYVIQELGQAGSTLASLHEGFATRSDQTITVNDPGGLKLLAATDDIDKLFDEFKASIPQVDGKNLTTSVTELKDLVLTRNNAVTAYNSALELLRQATIDRAYYTKQAVAYGAAAATSMNTALPSILLWLRRTRDNFALESMRLLNYANRAIQYWGLTPASAFPSASPLSDYQTLLNDQASLSLAFEQALGNFAGGAPSHWPTGTRSGGLYKLSFAQLFALQTVLVSPTTGGTYYSVTIALAPGATGDGALLPLFAGRANIRLDRIRLWLVGAQVGADDSGAHPISIVITQLGREVMVSRDRTATQFQHDAVSVAFQFDSTDVQGLAQCTEDRVLNQQFMASYFTGQGEGNGADLIAAIGPWSAWKFEVRSAENAQLDMSQLTEAWLEFGGWCSAFSTA